MTKASNNRLKKIIDKYDVISFDIFDTLIKRNCLKPTDIFEICEIKYNECHSHKVNKFREIRMNAQQAARTISKNDEILLDDIYSNIEYDNLNKNDMKNIEIETEIDYCVQNLRFKEIYDYCVDEKKIIVFVSDMYLDEKIITKILNKNGYKKGRLYLSSTYNKTKYNGGLFNVMLEKEKVKPNKVLHIGDSKKADFISPRINRIKSYKIKHFEKNTLYISPNDDNIYNNILSSFINNTCYGLDKYQKIGYELLGPMCYSFCNWLHKMAKEKKIKKILFCARDMRFIHTAYNYIYGDDAIPNEYFYVSRKSLRLPYFYKNNDLQSFQLMIPEKKMKMKDLLNNLNLEIDDKIIEQYGFYKGEYNCYSLNNNDKFVLFFNDVIYKYIISSPIVKEQYDNFTLYLRNIGFDKNCAIVDLGWKGTTQYSMSKTLGYDFYGFYFGLEKSGFKELNGFSDAFFFNKNDDGLIENEVYSFRSLFEIMFASQQGSTLKYSNNSKKPYVLGQPDNIDCHVIEQIQEYSLKFVEKFSQLNIDIDNTDHILNNFIRIGINPTYKESDVFGDIKFSNMIDGYLAKPDKFYKYIFNPIKFKREVFLSEWKIGFMKRLFKIKLPYYKIYSKLKKMKDGGKDEWHT